MSNNVVHAKAVMAVPMTGGQDQGFGSEEGSQSNYNQQGEYDAYGGGNQGMSIEQMADQIGQMQMEQNVYDMEGGVGGQQGVDGNWADDTIERSGNLFNQLDSMIAAVQTESSALDKMVRPRLQIINKVAIMAVAFVIKLPAVLENIKFSWETPIPRAPPSDF